MAYGPGLPRSNIPRGIDLGLVLPWSFGDQPRHPSPKLRKSLRRPRSQLCAGVRRHQAAHVWPSSHSFFRALKGLLSREVGSL